MSPGIDRAQIFLRGSFRLPQAKSLKSYREKYHPKQALRFSMQNLKRDDGLLNVPLYLIHRFHDFLHAAAQNNKDGEM